MKAVKDRAAEPATVAKSSDGAPPGPFTLSSLNPQRHINEPDGGLLKTGKLLGTFIG